MYFATYFRVCSCLLMIYTSNLIKFVIENYCLFVFNMDVEVFFMDYNNIILELLDRIKTLENKVSALEAKINNINNEESVNLSQENNYEDEENEYKGLNELEISSGGKYYSFTNYLRNSNLDHLEMTFDEIENILGFNLPSSIRKHRANWSNTTTLSFPCSWLKAGYKTREVDMFKETVTFYKDSSSTINSSSGEKYYRLTDYLKNSNQNYIRLSFEEIENILGFNLPSSAFNHQAFWSNSRSHSFACAWLNAGYRNAGTNLLSKYAEFRKV